MPRTMNMVPIDAGKLRAELQKRGFDAAKASVEIGYAPSYLASMVFKESAKGKLPERALILLFERLNIRRESIEIVERAATEEPETPPPCSVIRLGQALHDDLSSRVRRYACCV